MLFSFLFFRLRVAGDGCIILLFCRILAIVVLFVCNFFVGFDWFWCSALDMGCWKDLDAGKWFSEIPCEKFTVDVNSGRFHLRPTMVTKISKPFVDPDVCAVNRKRQQIVLTSGFVAL